MLIISIILVSGCTNSKIQQQVTSTPVLSKTPTPAETVLQKTIKAKCSSSDPFDDLKPFHYSFTIDNNKYVINKYGKVTLSKPAGQKISKHLWKGDWGVLTRLYYMKYGDDLILIYEHGGEGFTDDICRLNANDLSAKFTTDFFGYKVSDGYRENDSIYVSSIIDDEIKFSLNNGEKLWDTVIKISSVSSAKLTGDTLELYGRDSNYASICSKLDKGTGEVLKESAYISANILKYPYLDTTIPIIGQKYSTIKSNVNKWVYGRSSKLLNITNYYSSVWDDTKRLLGFKLLDTDELYFIRPMTDIFVLRDGIFVAELSNFNKQMYVADILTSRFMYSKPNEKDIKNNKYYNFLGNPQLSIMSWRTNNAVIRVLTSDYTDTKFSKDDFFKRTVSWYVYSSLKYS